MASAEFQVRGIKELQARLKERGGLLRKTLEQKLLQLCEDAVTHAKKNKGYKDRKANLKNSISFALFYDGELLIRHESNIPKPEEDKYGQEQVKDNLDAYISSGVVAPKGFTLAIVAGMNYGAKVQAKGYNVLYLTKYYLRDELRKILEETLQDVMKG